MSRSYLIDSLKALLSQLILLHHFFLYSPMADAIAAAWPALADLLIEQGPLAVPAFLAIGGFLSARALLKRPAASAPLLILQRYLRLAPPLVLALLLVLLATLMHARDLAQADWLSPLPSWPVFLAHVLLLQDVLGMDSISAGAWYVAVDLQLFALLVGICWLSRRGARPLAESTAPALLALATAISVMFLNHQPELDVWGIYFLPAYGLGALTAWARVHPKARLWWLLTLAVVAVDWLLLPRERPLYIVATALALHVSNRIPHVDLRRSGLRRAIERLADLSYPLFVCHFAAIIVASGLWMRWRAQGVELAWAFLGLGWLLALGLAWGIEQVCERIVVPLRHRALPA